MHRTGSSATWRRRIAGSAWRPRNWPASWLRCFKKVAILFDGDRLEALRRENPHIPQYWTPDDWRVFFAEAPSPSVQVGWGRDDARVQDLERTIQELRARLAGMEAAVSAPAVAEMPSAPVKRLPREDAVRVAKRNSSADREEKPAAEPGKVTPVACNLPVDLTPPLAACSIWRRKPGKSCPKVARPRFRRF